ncbi:MAG: hypothetical protein V1792_24950 [Pseudomonadota bacterium]
MTRQDIQERPKPLWKKLLMWFGVLIAIIFVSKYDVWIACMRNLPSDEEMIANFHKHRAEFEQLAKIYREDLAVPTDEGGCLRPTPHIEALMERINVSWICGDQVVWIPPDPYSKDEAFQSKHSSLTAKWFSPERREFSGVIFRYAHGKKIRFWYGERVDKRYYYFPFAPRIHNGTLIVPATLLPCIWGGVFQTLNTYPPHFKTYDYAYKKIAPNWYIQMHHYGPED